MRNLTLFAILTALLLSCSGCIYSNVRIPMSRDFQDTQRVEKNGKSSSHSILWLVAWGDAGLQKAAKEGDLETLEYVDYQFVNVIFGLYMSRTTIVYGR